MKCNWATSWFGNGVGARCQVFCCITHVLSTEYTDPCSTFLYKVCRTTWVWCRAVLSCLVRSRLGGKALIRPKPTLIRWLFNALAQLQNIQEKLKDKTNYVGMLWIHTADERKLEFEMVRVKAPYCSNHSNLLSSSSSWAFIFFDPLPGWPRGGCHCHRRVEGRHHGQFRLLLGDGGMDKAEFYFYSYSFVETQFDLPNSDKLPQYVSSLRVKDPLQWHFTLHWFNLTFLKTIQGAWCWNRIIRGA